MSILVASLIALCLICATVLIHYEFLRAIAGIVPRLRSPPRSRVLIVIGGVLVAHVLEIILYAVAYWLIHDFSDHGSIAGELVGGPMDFFYISATSYTTLGVGDIYPRGALRLLVGVEALNGFVLIGWSASFTYLAMEKLWGEHRTGKRANL
jgi:hypothetical protein